MSPWSLILGWFFTAIIVIGNGLVIYLITKRRNLRTTTNWFVLSLAVADFGFGALFFPRYSSCFISNESCVNPAVIIAYSLGYCFTYASVTNLCALTLDRYLAIVKPLRYLTFMTKKRVALLIFAAWSVAFLVLVSCLLLYFSKTGKTQDLKESIFWTCLHCLTILVCGFLSFTTAQLFLIVRTIEKRNHAVVAQLNFNHRIQHREAFKAQETASAKMVGIVVTIFIICYLVNSIFNIFRIFKTPSTNETLDRIDKTLLPLLKLLNSAINPAAYALYKREIRRELKRMLCRKRGH